MGNSRANPDGSTTPKVVLDGFIPLLYVQQVNQTGAESLPSLPANARMALISASVATGRWTADGTVPTSTLGMPLTPGQEFQYVADREGGLSVIQICGAGTTWDIHYFR
jgi:hypothetical protein